MLSPSDYLTDDDYYIEKRMENDYNNAREKLATIIHPKYIDLIAQMLWWSCEQEDQSAITLADKLEIGQAELVALSGNQSKFWEIIREESFPL